MAITATAGNVAARIEPRRPSWADMHAHYPGKSVNTETLYNSKIGGAFTGQHKVKWMENTCAVRMSYALLHSGFHLAQTTDKKASMSGSDRNWYWLRVADLRSELASRFKGFDAELIFDLIDPALADNRAAVDRLFLARKAKAQGFINTQLAKRNGIIVFAVEGWENATGHFTLWDGTTMQIAFGTDHDDPTIQTYYPWLTDIKTDEATGLNFLVQVAKVQFWELK